MKLIREIFRRATESWGDVALQFERIPRRRTAVRRSGRHAVCDTLEVRQMLAADFQVVRDINTEARSQRQIQDFVQVGSTLYFTAETNTHGRELWKTDGTTAGTVMVRDIFVGHQTSYPRSMVNVNGTLFFAATDGTRRNLLWKTDGTWEGTVVVKEFLSASSSGLPFQLTNVNGSLYFSASDGVSGVELWKSDGTTAGTQLVRDIATGSSNLTPVNLTNVNGRLFFSSLENNGLFVSDGTADGTRLVKTGFYNPEVFVAVGDTLYFRADDGIHGSEIWTSDGTTAGTTLLKDLAPGGNSGGSLVTNMNGTAYFGGPEQNGKAAIYRTDGTEAGTVIVRGGFSTVRAVMNIGGVLYFAVTNASFGHEIWRSDGTTSGTTLVASREGRDFINLNGMLYFTSHDSLTGRELWKTNGTSAGTVLVTDLNPGPRDSYPQLLTNVNGVLFFTGVSGTNIGVWKSDGTATGTSFVKKITSGTADAYARELTNVDGTLYFATGSYLAPSRLWVSENSALQTHSASELRPLNTTISNVNYLTNHGGTLYFVANSPSTGQELWKTDGTDHGTVIVRNIAAGSNSSSVRHLQSVGTLMYFSATDYTHGHELWRSDGTEAGTVRLADINSGYASSEPSDFIEMNGIVYFSATSPSGRELWRTDGTTSGTQLVRDIYPGPGSSVPEYFEVVNGVLYFQAQDVNGGDELWKSDGTAAGTVLVSDIRPGIHGSRPRQLTNVNGTLFFTARGPDQFDDQLWSTDGTTAGTQPVSTAAYWAESLTAVGDTLYFSATSAGQGIELWKSDGTAAGTSIVRHLRPGPLGSEIFGLIAEDNRVFFRANDGVHGLELWESDGTAAGTRLVDDITNDSGSSYPTDYVFAGTKLFAAAVTEDFGAELYVATMNFSPTRVDLNPVHLTENQSAGTVAGSLTTVDPNAADAHVYSLVTGDGDADNAWFRIVGSSLVTAEPLDYETRSVYSVRVRSMDQEGLWTEAPLSISIQDVNEAPRIQVNDVVTTLPENTSTAAAILLARIDVVDDALGSNSITLSGPDAGSFEILGSRLYLRAESRLDFETQAAYSVTVNVDDATLGGVPGDQRQYSLQLSDVNEAPWRIRVLDPVTSVAEFSTITSPIRIADIAVDDDALGSRVLSLSGPDAGVFEVSGHQLLLKSGTVLDFEGQPSLSVTLNVDDAEAGGSPDAFMSLLVHVLDVNEAPSLHLENVVTSLPESDNAGGTRIADIQISDDALGTNVVALAGVDASRFLIADSRLFLRPGVRLDYESQRELNVTVQIDDSALPGTPDVFASITLQIRDINDQPSVRLGNPLLSIAENTAVPIARRIADIHVSDDALGTSVLTLTGAHSDRFFIADSQLWLHANSVLDFETHSMLQVTVRADDPALPRNPDGDADLVLRILDVNEAPSFTFAATVPVIAENSANNVRVRAADLNVNDDALGSVRFVLSGPDAALFAVSSRTLWIRSGTILDFETRPLLQVIVGIHDPSIPGSALFTRLLTIRLTDINEKPSIFFENSVTTISENTLTTGGIRVADIRVLDDALGSHSLSLAGRDGSKFRIQNRRLFLREGTILNYEQQSLFEVIVIADDPTIAGAQDAVRVFQLRLRDLNERPTMVRYSNSVTSIPENTAIRNLTRLADLVIVDDALGHHVITLTGDDAGFFRILNQKLYLVAGTVLDFEQRNSLTVFIAIDDTTLPGFPDHLATFTLNITDVNEAPRVSLSDVVTSLPDSTTSRVPIVLARISVADDALGRNTLTLAGPDAAKFAISGSRLVLRSGIILNGRTQSLLTVQILVRDLSIGSTPVSGSVVTFRMAVIPMTPQVTRPAVTSTGLPIISWRPVREATGYQIRIFRADDLRSPVIQKHLSTNSFRLAVSPGIGQYVVEVRSFDRHGQPSRWSDKHNFAILSAVRLLPAE